MQSKPAAVQMKPGQRSSAAQRRARRVYSFERYLSPVSNPQQAKDHALQQGELIEQLWAEESRAEAEDADTEPTSAEAEPTAERGVKLPMAPLLSARGIRKISMRDGRLAVPGDSLLDALVSDDDTSEPSNTPPQPRSNPRRL